MSDQLSNQILQKIIQERKRRGLTISVLSRQIRLRQEFLSDLEQKKGDNFSLPELRQIEKLAIFLKIDFDQKEWQRVYIAYNNNKNIDFSDSINLKPKSKSNPFIVFTLSNLNTALLLFTTFGVFLLVGLPAYLVVRPAEIFWTQAVENDTILITKPRQTFSGNTARAKTMFFGGQEVLLKDGYFSLDLPKPDQPVVVPLILTNYFNLTTEYQIVIKPNQ